MKKRLFAVALAATMALASAVSAFAAAPEGSVAYFSFDETIDGATAVGKAFAATDKTEWTYVEGKEGMALNVNAEGDNVGLDTNVTIGTGDYSVSFWAKANTCSFAAPLIWIGSRNQSPESWNGVWTGLQNAWTAGATASGSAGAGSNDSTGARVGIAAAPNNATATTFDWTYITLTVDVDTTTATLYYDGVQVGQVQGYALLTEDANLYVGANYWDAPADYVIDELAVWDKTLTGEEVAALAGVEYEEVTTTEAPTTISQEQINQMVADKNNAAKTSTTAAAEEPAGVSPVVIVVIVVVVVAVIAGVVVASKKKKN